MCPGLTYCFPSLPNSEKELLIPNVKRGDGLLSGGRVCRRDGVVDTTKGCVNNPVPATNSPVPLTTFAIS